MSWYHKLIRPKVGIREDGIGLVHRGMFGKNDNEPQDISLQQQYDNAYNNYPLVAAAIDIQCEQAVQDFYFEGPNSRKLANLADKLNLGNEFYKVCKCGLKNGNCWVEFPKNKKKQIVSMKILDPKTMTAYRTNTGNVIGHSQEINGMNKVLWGSTGDATKDSQFQKRRPLSDIVHFKFNSLNSEKYGSSLIHPVLPMLDIKDRIESSLKVIVQRYAAPIIHAQVGDETHVPSEDDMTDAESQLEDIYADTEYVTSYLVKMSVLGFEGKGLNLEPILMHIDNQIVTGLQTPLVLLGRGEGTDKAVAEVQLRSFTRHIKCIQRVLKIEFEDKVIVGQGLGTSKDKLVWDIVEEREKELEIDMIRGLKKDGIITAQKANDLLPEKYREKLPEHMRGDNPLNPFLGQTGRAFGQQDQYPFQQGANKIKDNATDPTKKRDNKSDIEVPVK